MQIMKPSVWFLNISKKYCNLFCPSITIQLRCFQLQIFRGCLNTRKCSFDYCFHITNSLKVTGTFLGWDLSLSPIYIGRLCTNIFRKGCSHFNFSLLHVVHVTAFLIHSLLETFLPLIFLRWDTFGHSYFSSRSECIEVFIVNSQLIFDVYNLLAVWASLNSG